MIEMKRGYCYHRVVQKLLSDVLTNVEWNQQGNTSVKFVSIYFRGLSVTFRVKGYIMHVK